MRVCFGGSDSLPLHMMKQLIGRVKEVSEQNMSLGEDHGLNQRKVI